MAIRAWKLVALLVPLLLAACSTSLIADWAAPAEDRALGRAAVDDLIAGNQAALAARLPPQVRPQLPAQFKGMRDALPFDAITDIRLVDAGWLMTSTINGGSVRTTRLGFELVSGDKRALVQMVIFRQRNVAVITSFNVSRLDQPAMEVNGFRLGDMTLVNFGTVLLALAAFATMIAAIRRIWISPAFRWRWLWTVGCLIGFFQLTTLWGSTYLNIAFLTFTPFSAGMIRYGLAPWTVIAGLPVVAIWALLRHRALNKGAVDG